MAVAFRDYIVAIEAPGSSEGADKAIQMIKEALPGKPIRYVALTHHHSDHIGGLRSFIAEGATVITTRANRGVVETMAAAPQNDRLARAPRKPEFLFVEGGRRVLTDGEQTVELIDVGPNPHAKEMLIAWLPKQRIVFQGDLFFVPEQRRAGRTAADLDARLREEAAGKGPRAAAHRQRARPHSDDRGVPQRGGGQTGRSPGRETVNRRQPSRPLAASSRAGRSYQPPGVTKMNRVAGSPTFTSQAHLAGLPSYDSCG